MEAEHPPIDDFGRDYLRLALNMDRLVPGFLDAYYGPPELKALAASDQPKSPTALLAQLQGLEDTMSLLAAERQPTLAANLRAIGWLLRTLNGEEADYLEEVRQLLDVEPQLLEEQTFLDVHCRLDVLLEGKGGLAERMIARRKRYEVPAEGLLPLLELAHRETRERTRALFELPAGEGVELELVSQQAWSAFNFYLGNGRSLIQFNTDLPASAPFLLELFAHEGYPGHHTEATLKDLKFYRGRGWAEDAIRILLAPEAVISEGIATTAVEIICPADAQHRWNAEVLLPAAGLPAEPLAVAAAIREARRPLEYVDTNAAFLYHTGQLNADQTVEYFQTYGLLDEERARKSLNFISHGPYRAYAFTYTAGYDLIAQASAGGDKRAIFEKLLTDKVLPSQLAAMAR
ncbi:MAG: hypothetical protein ACRDHL_09145 [Candidatus Promineifilaceae bacterium]